jgi:hypothetical protein
MLAGLVSPLLGQSSNYSKNILCILYLFLVLEGPLYIILLTYKKKNQTRLQRSRRFEEAKI